MSWIRYRLSRKLIISKTRIYERHFKNEKIKPREAVIIALANPIFTNWSTKSIPFEVNIEKREVDATDSMKKTETNNTITISLTLPTK